MKKLLVLLILLFALPAYAQVELARMSPAMVGGGVPVAASYTWSYVASANNYSADAAASLSCSGALTLTAGDTLVVWVSSLDNTYAGDTTITVDTTDSDNALTMESEFHHSIDTSLRGAFGVLASSGSGSKTFRVTFGNAVRAYRSIIVMQFRKSGGTASKNQVNTGTGTGTTAISGNITTTVANNVICGGQFNGYTNAGTSHQITGTNATGTVSTTASAMWYSIFTSVQTDAYANFTSSVTDWICNVFSVGVE